MPRRGYQNKTKKTIRQINKTHDAYYRHYYIIRTLQIEKTYTKELVEELDKLSTYLLFHGVNF